MKLSVYSINEFLLFKELEARRSLHTVNGHRYILIKGKAGLGNRLLCALTGILYARITDRRAIVDWRDYTYSEDGSNAFTKLFLSPYIDSTDALAGATSVCPEIWQGRLDQSANDLVDQFEPRAHASFKHHWQFSFDLKRIDFREDVLVMWSFSQLIDKLRPHFRGEFATLRGRCNDDILRWMFETSVSLHPDIAAKVDAWHAEHLAGRPTIGVHVRFMDRAISLDYFTKHLDRLVAARPEATIFLATDNPQVMKTVEARYPRIVSTPKWYPDKGVSMHQNPECPDRFQNAVDALVDMALLARCDYLVYPRSSTFSYISSLLTTAPRENVIDVEHYHAKTRVKRFGKELYLRFA